MYMDQDTICIEFHYALNISYDARETRILADAFNCPNWTSLIIKLGSLDLCWPFERLLSRGHGGATGPLLRFYHPYRCLRDSYRTFGLFQAHFSRLFQLKL